MKVHCRKTVSQFIKKHADVKTSLEAWYNETVRAKWAGPVDIKRKFASASFLADNHVVFNIKGNRYRIVVKIAYKNQMVFIKWLGTHAEYDKNKFP